MAAGPGGAVPGGLAAQETAFQNAVSLRRQGEPQRADALCAELLRADPGNFNAYHLRGLIALETGETHRGIALIGRSLAINPNQPLAYSNVGNALLSAGEPLRALQSLDAAIALKPDLGLAHYNRGNALKALRRLEEAAASYETAVALDAGDVKAWNNRGLVQQELGRLADALASFEHAAALDPRFPGIQVNLGAVLVRLGRLDEAVRSYSRALRLDPANFEAWLNVGSALQGLGRLEEARESCEQALKLKPDSGLALVNTGNVLLGLGRAGEALECYERALRLAPQQDGALHGRAASLLVLERLEEADAAFAALLAVEPDHPSAVGNLFQLRMNQCDWRDYDVLSMRLRESLSRTRGLASPLSLLMIDEPEVALACARAWCEERYPEKVPSGACIQAPAAESGKIRIAYVSADLCDHPVAHLLIGALERHDRNRFELIGVSLRPPGCGPFEARVRGTFDRYIDVSARTDQEAAEWMRLYGVDIAVDLMGLTDGFRLGIFAHRPAPVQVSYLGYAGTVGAPYMDYLLADELVVPPGAERWYREQVVRLPGCYLPADNQRKVGNQPTRAHAGLPAQGFVFCAFTKAHKINPTMFDRWMRLLQGVPGSILWLREMGESAEANLRRHAGERGIDADRLVFAPRVPSVADHLARHSLADLYLDTLPYNAHSTASDALWAG
ncbi:MAG TPA: tetratricopeptide repeat protein, partial [Steroidobacteraceae bacterium]|nr:tetratricopeptide repeat protein [Steroidobacteraceae bacterium]